MRPHSTGITTKQYVGGVLAIHGILVITFLLALLLSACASVPRASMSGALAYDGVPKQVEAPRCTNVCWLMSARNENYFEARVYISGQRVATLPGMMANAVGIPVTRSMLDAAGCIVVFVKLYPDMKTAFSSRECPVPGSRLELAIDESYGGHPLHLWLQDWRTR